MNITVDVPCYPCLACWPFKSCVVIFEHPCKCTYVLCALTHVRTWLIILTRHFCRCFWRFYRPILAQPTKLRYFVWALYIKNTFEFDAIVNATIACSDNNVLSFFCVLRGKLHVLKGRNPGDWSAGVRFSSCDLIFSDSGSCRLVIGACVDRPTLTVTSAFSATHILLCWTFPL